MYVTFHHNITQDKILLHTTIDQGGIQAMDTKTQTDNKLLEDLKNSLNISLRQVI